MSVRVQTKYRVRAHLLVINLDREAREHLANSLVEAMKRRDPRLNPEYSWGGTSSRDVVLEVSFTLKDEMQIEAERRSWAAINNAIQRIEFGDHIAFERRDLSIDVREFASS